MSATGRNVDPESSCSVAVCSLCGLEWGQTMIVLNVKELDQTVSVMSIVVFLANSLKCTISIYPFVNKSHNLVLFPDNLDLNICSLSSWPIIIQYTLVCC